MFPPLTQAALVVSTATAVIASAQVIDEGSLVPLGLLVAAVGATAAITWRVAAYVWRLRQDLSDAQEHLRSLERMYGRRKNSADEPER